MKQYVLVICRNCGNVDGYPKEKFNKKFHCECGCGNGNLRIGRKELIKGLKNDFEILGLEEFKQEKLFEYYKDKFKKTVDKGFDLVTVREE